ncbi:MAG TPA: SRPBCC domain-containing protein [Devosia sp.]|nr:SRPBCC domain-containing protein [Devosia sp.]
MQASYALKRGFALKRIFDAPPDVVFRAWTDPTFLGWFFNPGMEHDVPISVDLRVGGQWRQQMVENADKQYFTGGVYREIVPGEKLVFSFGAVGGWPPIDLDNLDAGPLVTLRFKPAGAGTEMELLVQLPDHLSEQQTREWMTSGMVDGWGQTIDRLVAVYARQG